MAKIIEIQYEAKLTRDAQGHVSLEVNRESAVELNKGEEPEMDSTQILGTSKEVSDFNQKELETAKASLFEGETERAVKVIEKTIVG